MPRRTAIPGSRSAIPRRADGASAGGVRAGLVTVLLGLLLIAPVLPGCSTKPARKKGRSKAAAARAREEKPLVDEAPEPVVPQATDADHAPADAPASPPPGAEPASPEGAPEDSAAAEGRPAPDAAPATPAPDAALAEAVQADGEPAPAAPTLGDEPAKPSGKSGKRPTSPLIDPDTAIALDGGRVEVSSPLGWTRSPRSQSYLVRYQPTPRKSIPSIVVTAEPAPTGLETVTRKNQADLVSAITSKLAVDFPAGGTVKVIKKPAAVAIGPHAGVAWAVPGSAKIDGLTETIDRFAWGVVLGGRLYVVEARGPRGKLDDAAKDRAKAVAATLLRPADAPAGNPEAPPAAAPEPE